ncbi:MAG: cofactor-independent phosphoglycerate mutase [Clostridiales bacterium]|nr:MAG: cofactor-independent phosphoglycerate mutase [Clostridiales bacterium]
MKYLVLLIDGAADEPCVELGGKTPIEAAKKPTIDMLAKNGIIGMVRVTPEGCKGGSDVGNLTVMGYDPRKYLTGRAPLEAASMGIKMESTDLALRANLVTVSDEPEYEDKTMVDYSAGEISTEEASVLINAVNDAFKSDFCEFYPGISYRHCLVLHNAKEDMSFTPPHMFTGKPVKGKLPEGDYSDVLLDMMKKSYNILSAHPINIKRIAEGKNPANSIWLWGQGRPMSLPLFKEKHGISGAAVTAVDLIKGIAKSAEMAVYEVEGATGNLHTNFKGKSEAARTAFADGIDLVYLHLEAPDECGHQGDVEGKVKSLEIIDEVVLKPIVKDLEKSGEPFAVLITPDHPTPLSTRGHSSADVPFALYYSDEKTLNGISYCEKSAEKSGVYIENGYDLIDKMISRTIR